MKTSNIKSLTKITTCTEEDIGRIFMCGDGGHRLYKVLSSAERRVSIYGNFVYFVAVVQDITSGTINYDYSIINSINPCWWFDGENTENTDTKVTEEVQDITPENSICYELLTWLGPVQYKKRVIVSAALRFTLMSGDPLVVTGVRHYSKDMHKILDVLECCGAIDYKITHDQGFVDQYSNYWSREDAYIIAKNAGQINDDRNVSDKELFSEGLY